MCYTTWRPAATWSSISRRTQRRQCAWEARRDGPPCRRRRQRPRSEAHPRRALRRARFPECVALGDRLAGMAAAGLENPFFRVKDRVGKDTVTIAGREAVSYTSFDYLGMARDPQVIAAAKEATDRLGHERLGEPAGGGQPCDSPATGRRRSPASSARRSGRGFPQRIRHERLGPGASVRRGRPDPVRRTGPQQHRARHALVESAAAAVPHNDFEFLDKLLRRHARRVSPRRRGHRGGLQHGRRLPGLAAVHRSQAAAQGTALCRRGALAGRHGRRGAGHLRTFRRRSGRRRHLDGYHQQGPGKLRADTSPARDARRVPEIHHARFRLRHRAFSRQHGGRLGGRSGCFRQNRSAWPGCESGRDCFCRWPTIAG